MKLGLTLPSFRNDPETALEIAVAAEHAELDGVFAFDHIFRARADGTRRPALECTTLLGAVATETERIAFGPLVARASLRPPATLATALDTLARIAPDRLIVTVGSGDRESRVENESFGIDNGDEGSRVEALAHAVAATRGRSYPVWVGGGSAAVRQLAATHADGWNRWGASVERFAREARGVREQRGGAPSDFTLSWAGLVIVSDDEGDAAAKQARLDPGPGVFVAGPEQLAEKLAVYRDAGAEWAILGPVDSSDPENAALLGERVAPLLR